MAGTVAGDLDLDAGLAWQRVADDEARAKRATRGVDFGLRQVERVFALDVARTHVVANRVAEDVAGLVDGQRHFRLGHVPVRIAADAHLRAWPHDALRGGLEENFRTWGIVDAIVKGAAAGVLGFIDAGVAAAQVGDACGPYFLVADRREELCGTHDLLGAADLLVQPAGRIGFGEKGIEFLLREAEAILAPLGEEIFRRAIKGDGRKGHG